MKKYNTIPLCIILICITLFLLTMDIHSNRKKIEKIESDIKKIKIVTGDILQPTNEAKTKKEPTITLLSTTPKQSFDNKELLVSVLMSECRGEDLEGIKGVVETIKNRNKLWKQTTKETLLAKGQFAQPYTGKEEVPNTIYEAIDFIENGGTVFNNEPVTHFHAKYVSPNWANKKELVSVIGNHKFYK